MRRPDILDDSMRKIEIFLLLLAIGIGSIGIDIDHFTPYPLFHYGGTILFFLFFAIGLVIFRKEEE